MVSKAWFKKEKGEILYLQKCYFLSTVWYPPYWPLWAHSPRIMPKNLSSIILPLQVFFLPNSIRIVWKQLSHHHISDDATVSRERLRQNNIWYFPKEPSSLFSPLHSAGMKTQLSEARFVRSYPLISVGISSIPLLQSKKHSTLSVSSLKWRNR